MFLVLGVRFPLRAGSAPYLRAHYRAVGFSGGADGKKIKKKKKLCLIMGDPGSIPGSGRSPREGDGYPLQYSCLENSMVGYSPWGHKQLDTTE